jgi:hypothetical protein
MRSKAMRFSDANRIKPELGNVFAMLHMDVRWLRPFKAIKEETKS